MLCASPRSRSQLSGAMSGEQLKAQRELSEKDREEARERSRVATLEQRHALELQLASQREIAERELRGTLLSNNRVRWIEELRSEMAGWVAAVRRANSRKATEFAHEASRYAAKISLRLNVDEPRGEEVMETFNAVARLSDRMVAGEAIDPDKFDDAIHDAIAASRRLLKAEWERVKKVE